MVLCADFEMYGTVEVRGERFFIQSYETGNTPVKPRGEEVKVSLRGHLGKLVRVKGVMVFTPGPLGGRGEGGTMYGAVELMVDVVERRYRYDDEY